MSPQGSSAAVPAHLPAAVEVLQRHVGKTHKPPPVAISRTDIARFALATGENAPIHTNWVVAREAGYRDLVAPTSFGLALRFLALGIARRADFREDGATFGGGIDLPTGRLLSGETRIEFGAPICAGDELQMARTLADATLKDGREEAFLLLEFQITHTNQFDEIVVREVQCAVLR